MRIEDDKYWREAARLPYGDDGDLGDDFDENGGFTRGPRPSVLREVIETILVTLLIFFVVRSVVQNFKVEGDSMLPTLHTEQYLLVNKGLYFRYDANFLARLTNPDQPTDMRYLFQGPQRGDIVVFEAWNEPRDFIKRVIAVEGETVEIRPEPGTEVPENDCDGCCNVCDVYVNNIKLNEPYINERPNYKRGSIVVPKDHVYVLGDNRRNSSDSHIQGPLPVERIVGTAFVSYWPQDRWGFLPHPTYAEMENKQEP